MNNQIAIVWFALDLRLGDNPALRRAVETGSAIVPVFVWAPEEEAPWSPGAASRWWLHQSLSALEAALNKLGSRLIVRRGPAAEALLRVAAESGAKAIFWNRRYEPAVLARDQKLERCLREHLDVAVCPGNVLFEPGAIRNSQGGPFQVFTPFWRACLSQPEPEEPSKAPAQIESPAEWPDSLAISDLRLEPEIDWATGFRETWRPGELGAGKQLERFLAGAHESYAAGRNRPDHPGTSRLSPHLHFGEISARQVWHGVRHATTRSDEAEAYLRELVWREFAYHLLYQFPKTPREPLRPEFRHFPWRRNAKAFEAWSRGKTGYPMVDAGMRELWHTGWMHNRVRMIVASFLVKHLLIPWQEGAALFWDTLVDADLANNTMGWQWTAGCGADAAPFFRIFNPITQGEQFDPDGAYIRRWLPELRALPNTWICKPWLAPPLVLAAADVALGETYPRPIVEHDSARRSALAALDVMKTSSERPPKNK